MKQLQFILSLLLCFLLVASAQAAQRSLRPISGSEQAQKRVALVIGNAAYQGAPPLRNSVNDAHAISNALNALGFEVIELTDASQKEMNRAITAFGEKLDSDTAALFFYAGHGLQVRGKNYIVPVDAEIKTESAVATEAVSVDAVLEQLNSSPVSIVILDACRNNPFERSFRKMGGGGLAQMDAPKGSFIAYATAPGKTAADGDGKNGLFTQELLKHINEPGVELSKMFMRVRASVAAKSSDAQMPWDSSSMMGEFYFKPGIASQVASLQPVPAPSPAPSPVHVNSKEEIEQESWESARTSNDIEVIKEYLKQYPRGRFVGQARILIATLKRSPSKPGDAAESSLQSARSSGDAALWAEVQKGNSLDDYNAYLEQYPSGNYAALAKTRIKKLQDETAAELARQGQEKEGWDTAQRTNKEDSYQAYLDSYPTGRYVALAQAGIDKLKKDAAAAAATRLDQQKQEEERQRQLAEAARVVPAMVPIPDKDFEVGRYLVTQGEWKALMGTNPSYFGSCGDNCPVEQVSWNDVQEFINKLNSRTGKQYRLPTEEEWEYACYGGVKTDYCGSDDIDAVGWYYSNSGNQTHPVGQKQVNGYGLYDMSGNVFEWMSDCYKGDCAYRMIRGGTWYWKKKYARVTYRYEYGVETADSNVGFRLARTVP
jgi:uncharacterized caspase-like protein